MPPRLKSTKTENRNQAELGVSETAAEIPDDEIDFVLDRPFLFLVTGQDGSILFSGVVRNIAET